MAIKIFMLLKFNERILIMVVNFSLPVSNLKCYTNFTAKPPENQNVKTSKDGEKDNKILAKTLACLAAAVTIGTTVYLVKRNKKKPNNLNTGASSSSNFNSPTSSSSASGASGLGAVPPPPPPPSGSGVSNLGSISPSSAPSASAATVVVSNLDCSNLTSKVDALKQFEELLNKLLDFKEIDSVPEIKKDISILKNMRLNLESVKKEIAETELAFKKQRALLHLGENRTKENIELFGNLANSLKKLIVKADLLEKSILQKVESIDSILLEISNRIS